MASASILERDTIIPATCSEEGWRPVGRVHGVMFAESVVIYFMDVERAGMIENRMLIKSGPRSFLHMTCAKLFPPHAVRVTTARPCFIHQARLFQCFKTVYILGHRSHALPINLLKHRTIAG